ncbi:MAG: hypothetical protein RBT72_08930, partial [Spirochaetia bacterium]|nr:hypothetical protein [Spirochaetia bacterium]
MDERFLQGRHFLKSNWDLVKETTSDQSRGLPPPPQQEPPQADDSVVSLPAVDKAYDTEKNPASAPAVLHRLLLTRRS